MRRLLPLVALFVIYLMTPGAGELTADFLHWAQWGHTGHASAPEHHQEVPEHGCSGPYHICSCHTATGFLPIAGSVDVAAPPLADQTASWGLARPVREGVTSRLFRPPIA